MAGSNLNSLDILMETIGPEYFDFIFIDGEKDKYVSYYERSFMLVKKGGVIAIDNTLWVSQKKTQIFNLEIF